MPAYESSKKRQHKCIGFSERLEQQRQKQELRVGPRPWLGRKLAVGIAVAIACYMYYVYVARFCVPMVRRETKALGSRTMGIAFLVVFNLLFLMFGWTYIKVVVTSPGYATHHVPKTQPPVPPPQPPHHLESGASDDSIAGTPYTSVPASRSQSRPNIDVHSFSNGNISPRSPRSSSHSPSHSRRPSHSRHNTHDSTIAMSQTRTVSPRRTGSMETGPGDGVSHIPPARAAALSPHRQIRTPEAAHIPQRGNESGSGLPPLLYSRRPPTHPALAPEYRYCTRDGIIKPMRTHHCRACGTCVLKYDHHCPWIGQCVGAFNQKFFVNFLAWCPILCAFIFSTLIALVVQSAGSAIAPSIDAQHIVAIVLSGIFMFFTAALFVTQVNLILINMTTVEHLSMERMRDRERSVLSQMTRLPCPWSSDTHDNPAAAILPQGRSPFKVLISRRKIVKQWDAEWGKIDTEGNLWWLGSKMANWEATMGRSKWGWILPIGRSLGDGLTYPTNPRFDRDGRWRRRSEWPDGLR